MAKVVETRGKTYGQPRARSNVHDLHRAILTGAEETVQSILNENSLDINATICGSTALSLSLYREKYAIFEILLCHKYPIHALDLNKLSKDEKLRVEPPLLTACRLGMLDAVKLLITSGANLETPDDFGHTSLWVATRQRYLDMVELLIQNGASVNPSDKFSHSPLYFAVRYSSKRTDIARTLILNGANVSIIRNTSLLHTALIQGDINVGRLIVEAGYNVSSDDKIRQDVCAGTLTRNPDTIEWLNEEMSSAASLQRQCRNVIRKALVQSCEGKYFVRRVKELPLPKSLLGYIALQY